VFGCLSLPGDQFIVLIGGETCTLVRLYRLERALDTPIQALQVQELQAAKVKDNYLLTTINLDSRYLLFGGANGTIETVRMDPL
jgi:hypothetical protein